METATDELRRLRPLLPQGIPHSPPWNGDPVIGEPFAYNPVISMRTLLRMAVAMTLTTIVLCAFALWIMPS